VSLGELQLKRMFLCCLIVFLSSAVQGASQLSPKLLNIWQLGLFVKEERESESKENSYSVNLQISL
jgi:hypothetical protein